MLFLCARREDYGFDDGHVVIRAARLEGATSFGVSFDGSDFKSADTYTVAWGLGDGET